MSTPGGVPPTVTQETSVGNETPEERGARVFVAILQGFLCSEIKTRGFRVRANISEWISHLKKKPFNFMGPAGTYNIRANLLQIVLSELDPTSVAGTVSKVEGYVSKKDLESLRTALAQSDISAFKAAARIVGKRDGVRLEFDLEGALQAIRAVRAWALSLALFKVSPLVLIDRASQGDRQAVLLLVKIDKLFLIDPCTKTFIREPASKSTDVSSINYKPLCSMCQECEPTHPSDFLSTDYWCPATHCLARPGFNCSSTQRAR